MGTQNLMKSQNWKFTTEYSLMLYLFTEVKKRKEFNMKVHIKIKN